MRNLSRLVVAAGLSASLIGCGSKSHDVTVNWTDTKQTIDGFGASSAFFGQSITNDQADQLFDPKKGIGLTLLRTMIGVPADTASDGSEPSDGTANPIPTAPEITTAQQAQVRGCQIWAAAWTPPPIWKTTDSKNGSGTDANGNAFTTNTLDPTHYQDFADYLVKYADALAAASPPVKLFGMSPANEPDYVATWDNAQWTGDTLTKFISQNMAPTLHAKYPDIKIIAPEVAGVTNLDPFVTPLLADSTASAAVPVIAAHGYQGAFGNYNKPQKAGKEFWETEWSQENSKGDTPDPSMASALVMAQRMHSDLVQTGMNAWSWWAIYINEDGLNDNTRLNPAFIQPDPNNTSNPIMFKRGFAFGNWSKFVRPGFQRLNASDNPNGGVYTEAYRDGSNHLAIIAINTNSGSINQKFIVNGATISTLTPWVTSPTDDLAAKDAVTLSSDEFTYALPGQSVVTFVNWDATMETPGLTTSNPDGGTHIATCELDCASPMMPNNLVNGGVTDFTDYSTSTGHWGSMGGLYGSIYGYGGPTSDSSMSASVDTTNKDLHGKGMVASGGYGGMGLSYCSCTTVAAFTQVQFDVAGSWPGCDLQLQIKTFDQTPTGQTPMGGCDAGSSGCYNYPVALTVAFPSATPQTVKVPLSNFSNWSATTAAQVVGLQWQWTYSGSNIPADAAVSDAGAVCPVDATVTNIKFLP